MNIKDEISVLYKDINDTIKKLPKWIRSIIIISLILVTIIIYAPKIITGSKEISKLFPSKSPETIEAEILIASNRNRIEGDFGPKFNNSGPSFYEFGWATVQGNVPRIQVPAILSINKKSSALSRVYTPLEIMAGYNTKSPCRSILFVPGFNNNLKDSIKRVYSLKIKTQKSANWMLFSWPNSRKDAENYSISRDTARQSSAALARLILRITDLSIYKRDNKCKFFVITEGMGAWIFRLSVQDIIGILDQLGKSIKLIDEVIISAADEDRDAFDNDMKLGKLSDISNRITIYFNRNDDVLEVSEGRFELRFRNTAALGKLGPKNFQNLPKSVKIVDVTPAAGKDAKMRHGYITESPIVIHDLKSILNNTNLDLFYWRRYDENCNCYKIRE